MKKEKIEDGYAEALVKSIIEQDEYIDLTEEGIKQYCIIQEVMGNERGN